MTTEQRIMAAVARADLVLCVLARAMLILVAVGILAIAVLAVRGLVIRDPPLIDYDAPGVDITSEGPEAFTEEYYKWHD